MNLEYIKSREATLELLLPCVYLKTMLNLVRVSPPDAHARPRLLSVEDCSVWNFLSAQLFGICAEKKD